MKKDYLFILTIVITLLSCSTKKAKSQCYQIVSKQHNESINIPNAKEDDGVKLIIWSKKDCRFNQEWKLEKINKYYVIRSKYNDKVITAKGKEVVQSEFKNLQNQLWKLNKDEDYTNIISVENGLALTAPDNPAENRKLSLKKIDKSKHQEWSLEPSGMQFVKANFNRILTPEEMLEDLDFYFEKLLAVHVNPYAFVGKDSVEQRKNELIKKFSRPLRVYEFNRELAKLNGLFDGHSNVTLGYNYIDTYRNKYGRLFPFEVRLVDNDLYIKSTKDSLNGLKITSINGIPSKTIITEIKKTKSLENEYLRDRYLETYFKNMLIALLEIEAPYKVIVEDGESGVSREMILKGDPDFKIPKRKSVYHAKYALREYKQDSIAIIEYNTCNAYNKKKWKNDIDSIFNKVIKDSIKYLFLDISRNGGGSSATNYLFFNNINHQPNPFSFKFYRKPSLECKIWKSKTSNINSLKESEMKESEFLSFMISKKITKKERENNAKEISATKPIYLTRCTDSVTDKFGGEIIIIQSNRTYSAAFNMATWFKFGGVGTIIGSETGQATELYCEAIPFQLPNSKVSFRVADNYAKLPNGNLFKGIQPHVNLGDDFYKHKYELEDLKGFLKKVKQFKGKVM